MTITTPEAPTATQAEETCHEFKFYVQVTVERDADPDETPPFSLTRDEIAQAVTNEIDKRLAEICGTELQSEDDHKIIDGEVWLRLDTSTGWVITGGSLSGEL